MFGFIKTLLYPYTVSVNKCGASCNTIDDPYARFCISDGVLVFMIIYRIPVYVIVIVIQHVKLMNI